jgi:hypothetical protein
MNEFLYGTLVGSKTVVTQDGNLVIQRSGDTYEVQIGRNFNKIGSMQLTSYI